MTNNSAVQLDHKGCTGLLSAILLQAIEDARKGDQEAAEWLFTPLARDMAELIGVPDWPAKVRRLVAAGFAPVAIAKHEVSKRH